MSIDARHDPYTLDAEALHRLNRARLHDAVLTQAARYVRALDLPLLVYTSPGLLVSDDPTATIAICHLLKAAIRQQRALPRPNRERILALLEALIAERRTLRAQSRRAARHRQGLVDLAVTIAVIVFALAAIARTL